MQDADEIDVLRFVARQNASIIRVARQRAEEELLRSKRILESRAIELERALFSLQTQTELTQVLVNAVTIDEVAETILAILCRNLSWNCAQLWRVDRAEGIIRLASSWCDATLDKSSFEALASFDVMDCPAGFPSRIWESKRSAWIDEIESDPAFLRTHLARAAGLKSVFGFPLIVAGEVSAVIELFSTAPRPADPAMQKLSALLGSHIGQFIERGTAEAVRRKTMEQMRRLQDVTATALANLPLKQLFENVLSKICEAMTSDMAVVLLLDEDVHELYVGAAYGPNVDAVRRFRLRIGESLAGRVAAERRFIQVRDAAQDPTIRAELRALGFQTILGVPLQSRNRLIGVLEVGSLADRAFTPDDVDLIHLVGQQLAVAIDNSSLYEEAREANRIKDRFLSIASHELRAPLTAILGWTQMLRQFDNDDMRHDALRTIESSAGILAELIGDLLDASRIREGKLVLRREAMDLPSIVATAVKSVMPTAEQRGVKLELQVPHEAPPILGDPSRIRQVVWNLLSNAIKFTPSGKRVQISVDVGDACATLTVKDEGDGISREYLSHIFDELCQEEKGAKAGGLGLGLHIVKTIVNLHGGAVEAHSDGTGRGATFVVTLPRNLSDPKRDAASS
jgi:signal transduction histidine kinase